MLLLNEKEYLKVTKAIYKKNKKELIFEICYHFSWDAQKEQAQELIFEDKQRKKYVCDCCADVVTYKNQKQIAKLVKYLNDGGRDDKVMTRLYKNVSVSLWGVPYPGRVVDNGAACNFTSSALESSFGFNECPILDE